MAHTHVQYLADSRYRTTVKYVGNGVTNSDVNSLDVSSLVGYQAIASGTGTPGGLVSIAKIYWNTSAPSGGFDLIWDAGTDVIAFICEGASGTYGYMPGQPAITVPRDASGTQPPSTPSGDLPTGLTGDVLMTNASATYTIVIEYHKVESAIGQGTGWTATG